MEKKTFKEIVNWLIEKNLEFTFSPEELQVWSNASSENVIQLAKWGFKLDKDRFKLTKIKRRK